MDVLLPVAACGSFGAALWWITSTLRRVQPDYVPRREPVREALATVVARTLPDGSRTPPETAAALLAGRPARAEVKALHAASERVME